MKYLYDILNLKLAAFAFKLPIKQRVKSSKSIEPFFPVHYPRDDLCLSKVKFLKEKIFLNQITATGGESHLRLYGVISDGGDSCNALGNVTVDSGQ